MGKSTAAVFLESRGLRVTDTDCLSRQLTEPGQPALHEIEKAFGPQALDAAGALNRGWLAGRVFHNDAERKKLESILHPRIRQAWMGMAADWRREGREAGVVVIPLLYETKAEGEFDAVLCVACSGPTQRARLRQRGWSDEQIQARNQAQRPVEEKWQRARYAAWTEGEIAMLEEQMRRIFAREGISL